MGLLGRLKRDRALFLYPATWNAVVMTGTLAAILAHEDKCHFLGDVRVERGLGP